MKRLITFLTTTLFLLMLVPKTAGAKTVYVKYTGSGELKIHYWGGTSSSDYPGNKMNKVAGTTNWYSYDVNTSTNFLVNTNGDNDKTANLSFPTDKETCYLTYDGTKDPKPSVTTGIPSELKEKILVDFYVKKVGTDPMGLYVWTDGTDDADHKWLGDWAATEKNLTNLYTDNNGDKWYKYTASIPEGEKICVIVRQGSNQSRNSTVFTISSSNKVFYLEWNGSGNKTNPVNSVDRSGMTFTEFIAKYYLIVPEENVGKTTRDVPGIAPSGHTAFPLQIGRERNKSEFNDDLLSLNLKIDGRQLRYNDSKIKFYIVYAEDKDIKYYFRPESDDYLRTGDVGVFNANARNQVDGYVTRDKGMSSSSNGGYYIIHSNDAKDTKSLTFMFSRNNASHTYLYDKRGNKTGTLQKGNAIDNIKPNGPEGGKTGNLIVGFLQSRAYKSDGTKSWFYENYINGNGVYIVGNRSTGYVCKKTNEYRMDRRLWLDGNIIEDNETNAAKADSIVYEIQVDKADAGSWDDFYLAFAGANAPSFSESGATSEQFWNLLLRPNIQDEMDGQALEGGIFYSNAGTVEGSNMEQSLNPLLTATQKERYQAYTVYFNATYSTYRVAFQEGFYIAGPAVNEKEDGVSNYYLPKYRHAMTLDEATTGAPHYVHTGYFTQGEKFAFFVNRNLSDFNYSEDADYTFVENNKKEDNENYKGMWETQAPTGTDAGKDYPFHNKVEWNTDGDDSNYSIGSANRAITWTLPSGYYTLRFYYGGIDGPEASTEHPTALYTVDKYVVLNNATSTYFNAEGGNETENLGGLRTFSDDCALWLPSGVQAYYVPEINNGRAVLKEVKNRIIPAHCPALIYDRNQLEGTKTIHLYPVSGKYTDKLDASEPNLLVDRSTESKVIQPVETVDGKTKYNFYMTNKYYYTDNLADRDNRPVPLNFWKARPGSTAKKNYTYLSVDENIFPVSYVGDKNYEYETSRENIINDARSYCFILSIGNVDDNNVVTGITSVETEGNKSENNVWYTIQGIKVASPVMPGLYIHNGKKVIIK